jgi:hypothetical protein
MKSLYKLFGIIALIAVIGFSFAACGDGGGGGGGGGLGGGGSGLVGKWYVTQETADARQEIALAYEFRANGKLIATSLMSDLDLTYTASGGKLTMTIMGYPTGDSADYSISGTELTIFNEGSSGFSNGTYYKPR